MLLERSPEGPRPQPRHAGRPRRVSRMLRSSRPLVAVLLGIGPHRFDRLVSWADDLAQDPRVSLFVQHGATPVPASLAGTAWLGPSELDDLLGRAWAVVCHGGAHEILSARTHRHRPVVVPRDPALGEDRDDHQRGLTTRLAARGVCATASSRDSLRFEVGTVLVTRGMLVRPWADADPPGPRFLGSLEVEHDRSTRGTPWPR